jgi:hypothetical protein
MRRLVIAVLLALPLAAACGSTQSAKSTHDGSGANIRDTLISAAGATTRAGSARVAMTMSLSSAGQSLMTMNGTGGAMFRPSRAVMTFRYTASPLLGRVNGMRMTEVMTGTTLYMRSPLFSAHAGKPWVKTDLNSMVPGGGDLASSGPSDPSQILGYLRSVSSSIQRVGDDKIRGVSTIHYRATVDYAQMAAKASPAAAAALHKAIQTMGTSTVPMDVWLDDQGRATRIGISMHMQVQGHPLDMKMSFDYFDFGAHVTVHVPPPSQVADMSSLPGSGSTSTGSGSAPAA